MDGRKISPFYRTLSPIGAAALPPPMKIKEKEEQGKGTADHLMPLGDWLYLVLSRAADLKGTMSYRTEGENFHESVRGKGFLRGQGGLEPWRSEALGGWGWGGGLEPWGDGRMFVRTDVSLFR